MAGGKCIIFEYTGEEEEPTPLKRLPGDKKYCYWPPYHSIFKDKKAFITNLKYTFE